MVYSKRLQCESSYLGGFCWQIWREGKNKTSICVEIKLPFNLYCMVITWIWQHSADAHNERLYMFLYLCSFTFLYWKLKIILAFFFLNNHTIRQHSYNKNSDNDFFTKLCSSNHIWPPTLFNKLWFGANTNMIC